MNRPPVDATYINEVLRYPLSTLAHQKLAKLYWSSGRTENARVELVLAEHLVKSTDPNVLGLAAAPDSTFATWQENTLNLEKNLLFWQTVAGDKPDYRDAYISAAVNAWQLGRTDQAESDLRRALTLDPNNTGLRSLYAKLLDIKTE